MSRQLPREDAWPARQHPVSAEQIPGAHLLEMPGADQDGWSATDNIAAAVEDFVSAIGRDWAHAALRASP